MFFVIGLSLCILFFVSQEILEILHMCLKTSLLKVSLPSVNFRLEEVGIGLGAEKKRGGGAEREERPSAAKEPESQARY